MHHREDIIMTAQQTQLSYDRDITEFSERMHQETVESFCNEGGPDPAWVNDHIVETQPLDQYERLSLGRTACEYSILLGISVRGAINDYIRPHYDKHTIQQLHKWLDGTNAKSVLAGIEKIIKDMGYVKAES